MRRQRYIALVIGLVILGCGVAANQSSKRTLLGVTQQQVLVDAQHALALQGYDVEAVDLDKGEIRSTWKKKTRRQVQFVVSVNNAAAEAAEPAEADAGPEETTAAVEISVQANTREKIVGGWSEAAPSTSAKASNLLDEIVELSVTRFTAGAAPGLAAPEAEPEEKDTALELTCTATSDCPAGKHCGSGYCIAECAMDSDCYAGYTCDERGRCLVKPEPCPTEVTVPTESGDTDQTAESEDNGDEEKNERRSKSERRRSRKDKEDDDE